MNLLRQAHEASRPTIGSIQRLFSSGELGGYWPEPKPSTVWQDTAGTTTGAVGSPVARRDDLSGLGYHAIQATTANCPILRVTPQTGKYWLDADSTDSLIATFPESLGSTCTEATLDPELGVVWAENLAVATTYDVVTKYGYNGGRFLINRALSAAEKAIVELVMLRAKPALGSELIVNGDFSENASGWTIDVGSIVYSVVDGELHVTVSAVGAYGTGRQITPVQSPGAFVIKAKSKNGSAGANARISLGNLQVSVSAYLSQGNFIPFGSKVFYHSGSQGISVTLHTGSNVQGQYVIFDDISIRRVL